MHDNKDLMNELLEVLEKSVSGYVEESNNVDVNSFIEIYKDKDFRHSYNKISRLLESKLTADQRDHLSTIIEKVMQEITKRIDDPNENEYTSKELEDINIKLYKLSDHVELEGIRINRMEAVHNISRKSNDALIKLNEQKAANENLSENVEKLDDKVNNFNAQSITILSIFAGLVLVFSSGVELLSQTFSHLEEMNVFKICIYLLTIGMVLFDIVFMMFYAVSKIACTSIAVTKTRSKKEPTLFLGKLYRKYPYVVWFNVLCLVAIGFMLVAIYLKL